MERLDLLRGRASGVTLYDLGEDGLPEKRTDADGARHVGGGLWLLDSPKSVELFDEWRMNRNPDEYRLVEFGEETPSEIDTAHLTPDALRAALEDEDLEGPIATAYRTDLQVKIAAPLACLLLPLIALFFSATGPPFPRPVHTLIASAIIAVTYALATSFAGSMGYGGAASAAPDDRRPIPFLVKGNARIGEAAVDSCNRGAEQIFIWGQCCQVKRSRRRASRSSGS